VQIRDRVGGNELWTILSSPSLATSSSSPIGQSSISTTHPNHPVSFALTIDQAQHRCPINEEGVVDKVRRIDNEARDTPFLGVFGLRQSQMIWKWESGGDVVL
jgi:hypothetical protein